MIQSGQDWRGEDGPRSLYGSSSAKKSVIWSAALARPTCCGGGLPSTGTAEARHQDRACPSWAADAVPCHLWCCPRGVSAPQIHLVQAQMLFLVPDEFATQSLMA